MNSTSTGFLAAGVAATGASQTQAVLWTSRTGLTWQRKTAAQLGLAGPGRDRAEHLLHHPPAVPTR